MRDQRFAGQPTKERRFTRKFSDNQRESSREMKNAKTSPAIRQEKSIFSKLWNSIFKPIGNSTIRLFIGDGKVRVDTHRADPFKRKLRKIARASRRFNLRTC